MCFIVFIVLEVMKGLIYVYKILTIRYYIAGVRNVDLEKSSYYASMGPDQAFVELSAAFRLDCMFCNRKSFSREMKAV